MGLWVLLILYTKVGARLLISYSFMALGGKVLAG